MLKLIKWPAFFKCDKNTNHDRRYKPLDYFVYQTETATPKSVHYQLVSEFPLCKTTTHLSFNNFWDIGNLSIEEPHKVV